MSDRAYELFRQALEADDRDAFLASCGELRADVEAYLKLAADVDDDFLARPAGEQLTVATFGVGDKVGRFTIRRLIASGGAGAVYEALQDEPRRTVAVKIMRIGFSPERFREEAQVLARLDHPDVAHVYEAGVHEGVPYIAMEYVVGAVTLGEHARGLDERARLELFARICDAVHHGHIKGVVHRDLKPANILVRDTGPKVIDFGIAQVEGAASGEIAGTLAYMSPEQCAGDDVDARTDVYSLGAVLHELVSGSLPFDVGSTSIPEAIQTIRGTPPPDLGGDLGAIVKKALAKDREERYGSASALADDVRRYLRAEPVDARPASWPHQLALLVRRRTGVVVALLALFAVTVAGAVVSLRFALRAEAAREDALVQAYQANIVAAASALQVHDRARAEAQLERAPAGLRNWEWRYLRSQLDLSERTLLWPENLIYSGTATPGARRFAATSHGNVRVWDEVGNVLLTIPRNNNEGGLAMSCALSRDGKRLAVGYLRGVVIHAVDSGRVLYKNHDAHRHEKVWTVAFAPDGELVAAASLDGTVRLCSEGGDRELARLPTRGMSFAFARGRLFAGDDHGVIHVLDPATGRTLANTKAHENNVESLALGPEGRLLLSCSMDGTVRLWDADRLALRATLAQRRDGFKTVAFAPDGSTCAAGGLDRMIRVWRVSDGEEIAVLHGHRNHVRALAYRADAARLLSFGRSDAIKFWDLRRTAVTDLSGLDTDVRSITLLGDRVAAVGRGGRVCVWDGTTGRVLQTRDQQGVCAVVDGETFVHARGWRTGEGFSPVCRRRLSGETDVLLTFPPSSQDYVTIVEITPDRGRVVLGTHKEEVIVYPLDGASASLRWRVPSLTLLTLSADGRLAATWGSADRTRVWRTAEGSVVTTLPPGAMRYSALAFRDDAAVLALGTIEGGIELWELATGRRRARLEGHGAKVAGLAFSPDGTRLASASTDGTVRIWDPGRAVELLVLKGHGLYAVCVKWSPDGKTLYSGGGGVGPRHCTIRVWSSAGR